MFPRKCLWFAVILMFKLTTYASDSDPDHGDMEYQDEYSDQSYEDGAPQYESLSEVANTASGEDENAAEDPGTVEGGVTGVSEPMSTPGDSGAVEEGGVTEVSEPLSTPGDSGASEEGVTTKVSQTLSNDLEIKAIPGYPRPNIGSPINVNDDIDMAPTVTPTLTEPTERHLGAPFTTEEKFNPCITENATDAPGPATATAITIGMEDPRADKSLVIAQELTESSERNSEDPFRPTTTEKFSSSTAECICDPPTSTDSAIDDDEALKTQKELVATTAVTEGNTEASIYPNWQNDIDKSSLVTVTLLQSTLINFTNAFWKKLSSNTNLKKSEDAIEQIKGHNLSLSHQFKAHEAQANGTIDTLRSLSEKSDWLTLWNKLENKILKISSYYNSFKPGQNYGKSKKLTELQRELAMDTIYKMAYGVCDKERDNFPIFGIISTKPRCEGKAYEALRSVTTKQAYYCKTSKSPQQLAFDLYSLLALTEAKLYAMMQFSRMISTVNGGKPSGLFQQNADTILRASFSLVPRTIISKHSTWYGTCVAPKHVENVTYIQFTELLQGYVVNEVNMNRKVKSCNRECKDYTEAEELECDEESFCNAKRCTNGKLYNCRYFKSDSTVCISNDKHRRYDWIDYKNPGGSGNRILGQKDNCDNGSTTERADSFWRSESTQRLLWKLQHCTNCLCLCDQSGPRSDRYISLKPSLANVSEGKIVTAVKFVKQGRVVHIQIQEGKALPRGSVNTSSIQWQPVELIEPELSNKKDYATLSWQERAINLDRLTAPSGHVLTGLRFRSLRGRINIEMQVAPIQFPTGWINSTNTRWIGSTPTMEEPRKLVTITDTDTPLRDTFNLSNKITIERCENEYMNFEATSMEKDVAQTTIPFLDAQPVAPQPPIWLAGVALCYRETSGNSGFINLKVATYNMTSYISAVPAFPPPSVEETNGNQNYYERK